MYFWNVFFTLKSIVIQGKIHVHTKNDKLIGQHFNLTSGCSNVASRNFHVSVNVYWEVTSQILKELNKQNWQQRSTSMLGQASCSVNRDHKIATVQQSTVTQATRPGKYVQLPGSLERSSKENSREEFLVVVLVCMDLHCFTVDSWWILFMHSRPG